MSWTGPTDLRSQLEKYWLRGDILRARLDGATLFPLTLRLRKPSAQEITERFADVADWVRTLREAAKDRQGYGYTVRWRQQRHRVHGANALPDAITVDSEQDALRLIGKVDDAARFSQLAERTLDSFPMLRSWLCQRPLRALDHESIWDELLAVLTWFKTYPRPGVFLRELNISGVHTKFIETHRGLIAEMLDVILPVEAIDDTAKGVRGFNRRYGLREKPALIRFRLLDDQLAIAGLTDLTVPVGQLARLDPGADTVFVTENEINGLAFPQFSRGLVIFGLGYGVDALSHLSWLSNKRLYYWGDIDTHGFAILNRLRHSFPQANSLLMDRATLDAHQEVWGQEAEASRFKGALDKLTEAERAVYEALRADQLAPRLRLEQEHVGQHWLLKALRCL